MQYKEKLSKKLLRMECTDAGDEELPVPGGIAGAAKLETIESILAMAGYMPVNF